MKLTYVCSTAAIVLCVLASSLGTAPAEAQKKPKRTPVTICVNGEEGVLEFDPKAKCNFINLATAAKLKLSFRNGWLRVDDDGEITNKPQDHVVEPEYLKGRKTVSREALPSK